MTATKVVQQDIEDEIVAEQYHILPNTTTTVCVLTGKTGWSETGISACADPANFDEKVGKDLAYKNAFNKWWPVLGFRLKDKLSLIEKAGAPSGKILELGSPVTYIGTKVVRAVAMTRAEYNIYRGWALPENENGDDNGFLVEYVDGGATNVEGHAGYVSWSPWDVFARAYEAPTRVEPKVETYRDRMKEELNDLLMDITKLTAFTNTKTFKNLPQVEQDDLVEQCEHMIRYSDVLIRRIKRIAK
jgi:hypothetical protein